MCRSPGRQEEIVPLKKHRFGLFMATHGREVRQTIQAERLGLCHGRERHEGDSTVARGDEKIRPPGGIRGRPWIPTSPGATDDDGNASPAKDLPMKELAMLFKIRMPHRWWRPWQRSDPRPGTVALNAIQARIIRRVPQTVSDTELTTIFATSPTTLARVRRRGA